MLPKSPAVTGITNIIINQPSRLRCASRQQRKHLQKLLSTRRTFSSTLSLQKMKIVPVPCRADNYMYLLIDEAVAEAAAVDPYDVPKITAEAEKQGVRVVAALTTHWHNDHAGGNKAFAQHYPDVPIYGGSDKVEALTRQVGDKDEFTIGKHIAVKCLATPCHTQDSISYYVQDKAPDASHPGGVFTGDTLFVGGCGRFFEGTGEEMINALSYLATLPDQTVVYNGHEYTKGNVAFGKSIDPENPEVQRLEKLAQEKSETTGITTIGEEKEWNVFMRLDSKPVREKTGASADAPANQIMDKLRELKNNFKG